MKATTRVRSLISRSSSSRSRSRPGSTTPSWCTTRPRSLRDEQPWRDVRVVVEPGRDDLVARLERAGDRVGEQEVERCHVRAERDLVRIAADEVGDRRATGLDHAHPTAGSRGTRRRGSRCRARGSRASRRAPRAAPASRPGHRGTRRGGRPRARRAPGSARGSRRCRAERSQTSWVPMVGPRCTLLRHERIGTRSQPRPRARPRHRGRRARRRPLGRAPATRSPPTRRPSTRCAPCSTPSRWTASS